MPNLPKAIPYRTAYYNNDWGFCLTKEQYNLLKNNSKQTFNVSINSTFRNGNMPYGELLIKGKTNKEILISCYICHPNIANDGLSGVALTSLLSKYLLQFKRTQWSYRIIFVPETIGAIAYCKLNQKKFKNIQYGLVVTCVGGKGKFGYKQSWDSNSEINYIVEKNFKKLKINYKKYKFDIHGSDERQYSANGFRLNCVTITKDKYYEYPYYHTSKDDLDFVNGDQIYQSFKVYKSLIDSLEKLQIYKNKIKCEPMLNKRNLMKFTGGSQNPISNKQKYLDNLMWIIFSINGKDSLEYIKKKLKIKNNQFNEIIERLKKNNIITRI